MPKCEWNAQCNNLDSQKPMSLGVASNRIGRCIRIQMPTGAASHAGQLSHVWLHICSQTMSSSSSSLMMQSELLTRAYLRLMWSDLIWSVIAGRQCPMIKVRRPRLLEDRRINQWRVLWPFELQTEVVVVSEDHNPSTMQRFLTATCALRTHKNRIIEERLDIRGLLEAELGRAAFVIRRRASGAVRLKRIRIK